MRLYNESMYINLFLIVNSYNYPEFQLKGAQLNILRNILSYSHKIFFIYQTKNYHITEDSYIENYIQSLK